MKTRIRIVMVSGNTPPALDGVSHYTSALLGELARTRPDWDWIWVGRRSRWFQPPIKAERGLTLVRPSHTWRPMGIVLTSGTIRLLRPDILHIQDQIHSFHETGAAAHLAKAASGRVIVTLHEFHSELPSATHTIELVHSSNVVIANDTRTAQRCGSLTGRQPDFTWWSGTNVLPAEASWGVAEVPFLITTFGQLSRIKDVDIVHEALVLVRKTWPKVRWQIVGPFTPASDPHHAELQKRLREDWISFTGPFDSVEDRRLRTALSSSQIMALPFTDGASPRRTTLQAAWAFGLPVVTTPPQVEEPDVIDGVNCLLVREPAPDAWARAFQRILTDPALRFRLQMGSLATAHRFRWSELARLHVELYESLTHGNSPARVQNSLVGAAL